MVQIGRINRLRIIRQLNTGAFLDGGESGEILLPKRQVPGRSRSGDTVEVFIYADKDGRLRATVHRPYATVGEFARLRVVSLSAAGAYLDWGLPKNLLVPVREQQDRMEVGQSYVVYVFLEAKKKRIAASSKLERFLGKKTPRYAEGEEVDLLIHGQSELGYRAIVNNAHEGMLYRNEVFQKLFVGQKLKGYVKKIRLDLKIDLMLQQAGYQVVDEISSAILKKIKESGGRIPVTDKSPPEVIYSLFGTSKKNFKKAIGALYKKRLVSIETNGIRLVRR